MIGARRTRREDARFLTGRGRYLADHHVDGLHHAAVLRSVAAHAVIVAIDTGAAAALPGVLGVYTQTDLEAAGARRMGHLLELPGMQPLEWTILASDRVRFAGEPIAAVVAVSRAVAEDALELIDLELEPLPAVVDPTAALAPGATLLYPEWGTNELLHLEAAGPGLIDAIERAPHVLRERYESHRIMGLPLEGHGAQAEYDAGSDLLTMVVSTQQPHQLRTVVAEVCGMTEASVRVIAPDMGGGFGNKQHFLREECLVALLARMTGVPVQWSEDRTEALTASVHSRPQVHDVTAAYDGDGRLLALKVDVTSDVGNPVLYFSGIGPSLVTVGALCGAYAVPEHGWTLSCVATTTCPVGAYRGFGQPQAHLTIERVMDRIAQALDLDPVEVRRRNLIPDDAPRPFLAHGGARLDIAALDPQFTQLLAEFGYDAWRARQAAARAEHRYLGLGVSMLVQGGAPTQYGVAGRFGSWEVATVSVLPDGSVTVAVGTKSQGQGHETTLAQVAADVLGIDDAGVTVSEGDTGALPYGMGSWGSRTAVMAGGAVMRAATELRTKMDAIARHMGREPDFASVAAEAWWHPHRLPPGMDPGLTTTVVYSPGNTIPVPDERGHMNFDETFASHATAVAVEVDPLTGHVSVLDAVMVVDSGIAINPAVVDGQHQGGFAQGLGNVFHEEVHYSDDGQPLCSTLVDYTIPGAPESVALRVVHRETPSDVLGGFRGAGEAAITAAPAVLVSAVEDALAPLGVRLSSTRLQASTLWHAIQAARQCAESAEFAGALRVSTIVCALGAPDAGATLVDAFSTQGYAALVGHGVADDVVETMRAVSLEFFDLPREEKARCEWVGHDVWRGWQPVFEGGERFADDSTVEWREWLEENLCPSAGGPDNPLNNWPTVPVALRPAWETYHAAMFDLAAAVIGLLAAELDADESVLPAWQEGQYSNLVANHYPAQTVPPKPGQVRVNPHTDHGGISILQVDDAPGGLEVAYDRVGWQAATVPAGALVVQAGDLLERLTAGRLRATPHRVVNPPRDAGANGRRLSLVYFHHPELDSVVRPATDGPRALAPILARDWIEQRQGRYEHDGVSDLLD